MKIKKLIPLLLIAVSAHFFGAANQSKTKESEYPYRPNILWIVVEDMSPHWSCYGETTIKTPHIDALATSGQLFKNVFVTASVCSPSRSALITGMFQATIGAHNHRSQSTSGKGGGNKDFYDSYTLPPEVPFLPEIFKKAGYYTVLGNEKSVLGNDDSWGKTDYNFVYDSDWYDANDWQDKKPGQPFFAQIQLHGGKFRDAPVKNPVNPKDVTIPPYYPDDEVIRQDWAQYLNSVMYLDDQVKRITERLEKEGIADSTVVFLFTDHGISHLRGKQFLYDEGIQIPLIVSWSGFIDDGKRREELVSHIDIAATSLHLAGLDVPEMMQGQPFYGRNFKPREYIYAGRDRCDETVDIIRAVRTPKFKYIRNYFPFKPYAQPNQYKDGKKIMQHMRQLYQTGELKTETARCFYPLRPAEELYDLENDPHEMHNLASNPEHLDELQNMQQLMLETLQSTNDLGFIPEPVAEILGKKHGNKFFIAKQPDFASLQNQCLETLSFDEENNLSDLKTALKDKEPAVRFWAAYGLGNLNNLPDDVLSELQEKLNDPSDAVKIAAARALCKSGETEPALNILVENMSNQNLIAGLYAALFIEDLDFELRQQIKPEIARQQDNPYNFTRRVVNRMLENIEE